jgi:DNA-binding protein H-NS
VILCGEKEPKKKTAPTNTKRFLRLLADDDVSMSPHAVWAGVGRFPRGVDKEANRGVVEKTLLSLLCLALLAGA